MEQTPTPTDPLARVVDAHRKERGLSWRAVAEAAAIPHTSFHRFVHGGKALTIPELERVAAVFGLKASVMQAQAEDVAA